jgi:mannitol-1-phosphate 5-dehydrogenase
MVPATPKEIAEQNPLAVCVEPYCELPVDKHAFKGEIPAIANMVPFAPFDFFIRRKLFMHNMSHALTAYFGALRGYTYIWEAALDADIRKLAGDALAEASKALHLEYGVGADELKAFSDNLLERFENKLLGDTIERVGKDTKRKLSENDRLVGVAKLCEKLGIPSTNILAGVAAGLHFAPEADESSCEVAKDARENGVFHALETYCGVSADAPMAKVIKDYYEKIQAKTPISEIIA